MMTASIVYQKTADRAQVLRPAVPSGVAEGAGPGSEILQGSTPAAVRAAAAHAVEQHLCDHYTRRPGLAPLCRAVAAVLTAAGVPLGENDVVVAGSPDEARYVAARALAPGRPVFALTTLPLSLATGLRFAGVEPAMLQPDEPLPTVQGGLLVFANPNPATGQRIDPASLRRVAAWVAECDLTVIADETAAEIHDEALPGRFAALPGMAARTLTLGAYGAATGLGAGLAAWQVSWFAGPKSILTPVRDLKQSITICTSAPSQYAALAVLQEAGKRG